MPQHEVKHTSQVGWEEVANGRLLKLAEDNGYNLLITADQSLPCQQSLAAHRLIGILALSTNNWGLMKPHAAAIVQAAGEVKPGEIRNLFCGRFVPGKFRRALEP